MSEAVSKPSAEMLSQLTRPTASYKRSAYLAVAGLLAFVLVYFGLAGWFLATAWRLIRSASHASGGFWNYVGAAVALLLAGFMLKAIFFVRNAKPEGLEEVTPEQQPRLFAYLHKLADAAGAPRPHRVFLSNRVNAAVFYDLSLANLIFPTKKNLEIGLPLVNALPLGELRAVLAHEFGHFAQRSMAVGRWVYLAQQIVQQVVARRDKFDAFIAGLGRIDFRLLAVAWALQIVVWSIRSLVESAFHLLVMVQSALSREMEMQADLVAVSLTGSDALIHALHRLRAADDAWDRTVGFAMAERNQGNPARDAYALQRQITWRMAAILDDPLYGNVPPLPETQPEDHRVFKAELGQPPKMWQSHPQNHEREQNAKRQYVAARIDQASAWTLFENAPALRETMTARLLAGAEEAKEPIPVEESLARLDHYYGREQYHGRYSGIYFARNLTRHAATLADLRAERDKAALVDLKMLYPQSLAKDVRELRQLEGNKGRIGAVIAGHLATDGGRVQLDGRQYHRRELPALKVQFEARIAELEEQLRRHTAQSRRAHFAIAQQLGQGWPEYLDSLLAVLHYAEHPSANLNDAYGLVQNTFSVVVAIRRQTEKSIDKLMLHCMALRDVLEEIYKGRTDVELDAELMARMEMKESWAVTLGDFTLPHVSRENINEWLNGVASWVRFTDNWLNSMRACALERLLMCETSLVRQQALGVAGEAAPAPCKVPAKYAALAEGEERKLQTSLSWWARFLRADGWLAGGARLAVAGAIVIAVLTAGAQQGETNIMVLNGLGTAVDVTIDGRSVTVGPGEHRMVGASPDSTHKIEARSKGNLIESFSADDGNGVGVYNVAGAMPLVHWTAYYGSNHTEDKPQMLGSPRWSGSTEDVLFAEPPKSVSSRTGSTRTVLGSVSGDDPARQMEFVSNPAQREAMLLAHARWDNPDHPAGYGWLQLAYTGGHPEILAQRLHDTPDNVTLRRLEQDVAKESPEVCAAARARAAEKPDDGDRAYLALRCSGTAPADDVKLAEAMARWPKNLWLKNMMLRRLIDNGELAAAEPLALQLVGRPPFGRDDAELELARIQRYTKGWATRAATVSPDTMLGWLQKSEQGSHPQGSPDNAYADLNLGQLGVVRTKIDGHADIQARMQRLVGASDNASSVEIRRALEVPLGQGIDHATVLTTAALALRTQHDPEPYFKAAEPLYGELAPRMREFLLLTNKGRFAEAEQSLVGTPLAVRGMAYSAGLVLAGPMAPPQWRKMARALLFAPERPYFRA